MSKFLEAEGCRYALRLPANDALHRQIQHLKTRPVDRPPQKPIVLPVRNDIRHNAPNNPPSTFIGQGR